METTIKKTTNEEHRKNQDSTIQQRNKDGTRPDAELEASLKTKEYKEMLKRLK